MEQRFPRYLNAPLQVMWLESDELALFFGGLTVALLFDSWVLWILPVALPYLYGRLKKKYPRGFLKHCLYFAGFMKLEGYPTFFEQEFLE